MHRNTGFTLIELMIVVAVIGILAAIAYPSYQESVRKSRRADCQGVLMSFASAMERHNTANGAYTGAGAGGGDTGTPTIFATTCPIDGTRKYYDLTINAAIATTYTLLATRIASTDQANDKCGNLTLTHTGVRGITSGLAVGDCWH